MHIGNLMHLSASVGVSADTIDAQSPEGDAMRKGVHDYVQTHDGHNKSFGVEMGYRYESSTCIASDFDATHRSPAFDAHRYIPSTYPETRVARVFLSDGEPIFQKLGPGFTLVSFAPVNAATETPLDSFALAAKKHQVPLAVVKLSGERHARRVWGADLVLVRPDSFVARHDDDVDGPTVDPVTADHIVRQAVGQVDRGT